jgi:hypothetical protein
VIDDFCHPELFVPTSLLNRSDNAMELLRSAAAGFVERHVDFIFVICPAKWRSNLELIEVAGNETAKVWSIKR